MALTKVTGSVIKDSVSLSGNVSVGGTLTYQDVTNVDALGIGTFRTGIKVLAGQVDVGSNIKLGNAGVITATSFSGVMSGTTGSFSGQVNVGSNIKLGTAGIITATSFSGSGANLTSLPAQATIANNADNRVITGGSGVNLNGESNLTFDGSNLGINGDLVGSNNTTLYSTNGGSGVRAGLSLSGSDQSIKFYTVNGGSERLRINSSGQLIVNTVTSTDAIFTVSSPNHYVVTSSGRAHKHIHCRAVNGNSGEYGGAISFGMGSNGSSAIAAEQMGSDGNVNGLAFFTHPTSTGSDDAVKRMKITSTGGIQLNNYGSTRGFIFQRLGAGTYPDFPNVQGSQGRGMCSGQRVVSANTATEIAKSHWGGLALVGYSNSQHQGTAQVMFGYGGAGASVRFSGHWVRQESLTITFTVSAYSLMISHNASNDLSVWCILIGV